MEILLASDLSSVKIHSVTDPAAKTFSSCQTSPLPCPCNRKLVITCACVKNVLFCSYLHYTIFLESRDSKVVETTAVQQCGTQHR